MPNMTVMAPKNKWELSDMLQFAIPCQGPVAIRYPRGAAYDGLKEHRRAIEYGKSEILHQGEKVAVLAVGSMVEVAENACRNLNAQGIFPTVVNVRFIKPLDLECLNQIAETHSHIVTIEENVRNGGLGQQVSDYIHSHAPQIKTHVIAIEDRFVEQGNVDDLRRELGLDEKSLAEVIREYWN
jgi:1-deoxy-D-xylulose-5-phosphate synthase